MKIDIRNLKCIEGEKYHCFEGIILINGKPEFIVKNLGYGGPNEYIPIISIDINKRIKEIDTIIGEKIVQCGEFQMNNSLEIVIGKMVDDYIRRRKLRNK